MALLFTFLQLVPVSQSVACLTKEPEVPGLISGPAAYTLLVKLVMKSFCDHFPSSTDSRRAVVCYWQKYGH